KRGAFVVGAFSGRVPGRQRDADWGDGQHRGGRHGAAARASHPVYGVFARGWRGDDSEPCDRVGLSLADLASLIADIIRTMRGMLLTVLLTLTLGLMTAANAARAAQNPFSGLSAQDVNTLLAGKITVSEEAMGAPSDALLEHAPVRRSLVARLVVDRPVA